MFNSLNSNSVGLLLCYPVWKILWNKEEWFEIFDEHGKRIGIAPRRVCHKKTFLRHRAVRLIVKNSNGKILLQKRSPLKDIQPSKWDTSVGGHVSLGEDPLEAIIRETKEELDINIKEKDIQFLYEYDWFSDVEREWIYTFLYTTSKKDFIFDKKEISEIRFWSYKEIVENLGKNIFTPNFETEFKYFKLNEKSF